MKEKQYKLTEKGKKILREFNDKEEQVNMQSFAANLLGYTIGKGVTDGRDWKHKR